MAAPRNVNHLLRLSTGPTRILARQCVAHITTSAESPATEPKPVTIDRGTNGKRRRPLTPAQQKFLDSAVCCLGHRFTLLPLT